jgi:hypothetical protein
MIIQRLVQHFLEEHFLNKPRRNDHTKMRKLALARPEEVKGEKQNTYMNITCQKLKKLK